MKIVRKLCIATTGLFLLITICVGLVPKVHSQEGRGKGDRGRQEGKRGIFLTEIIVSPNKVTADYINAFVPKDENAIQINRQVAHSYTITDRSH